MSRVHSCYELISRSCIAFCFQIVDPSVGFLLNRTCVQVQIEWLQSTILFQATYHPFDDITRIQSYQMRLVYQLLYALFEQISTHIL